MTPPYAMGAAGAAIWGGISCIMAAILALHLLIISSSSASGTGWK